MKEGDPADELRRFVSESLPNSSSSSSASLRRFSESRSGGVCASGVDRFGDEGVWEGGVDTEADETSSLFSDFVEDGGDVEGGSWGRTTIPSSSSSG